MKKKILSFIININNEFLLLRNNPVDPKHGGDFWYTVTGGFEKYETVGKDVTRREIKEETNLDVEDILYLNWIYKYIGNNEECIEYAYISFVKSGNVALNEENIDYKWCDLDEYIKKIKWYGDKKVLKKVLTKAINKKLYFIDQKTDKF